MLRNAITNLLRGFFNSLYHSSKALPLDGGGWVGVITLPLIPSRQGRGKELFDRHVSRFAAGGRHSL